jgi:hypothetical protein
MKKEFRFVLMSALSLLLAVAVVALQQTPPQTQSASGTISAVASNSFTISVQSAHEGGAAMAATQQDTPKSLTFMIDKNTTVEGKLAVGSNADVTYRDDSSGNHLAIAVRVTPKQ